MKCVSLITSASSLLNERFDALVSWFVEVMKVGGKDLHHVSCFCSSGESILFVQVPMRGSLPLPITVLMSSTDQERTSHIGFGSGTAGCKVTDWVSKSFLGVSVCRVTASCVWGKQRHRDKVLPFSVVLGASAGALFSVVRGPDYRSPNKSLCTSGKCFGGFFLHNWWFFSSLTSHWCHRLNIHCKSVLVSAIEHVSLLQYLLTSRWNNQVTRGWVRSKLINYDVFTLVGHLLCACVQTLTAWVTEAAIQLKHLRAKKPEHAEPLT